MRPNAWLQMRISCSLNCLSTQTSGSRKLHLASRACQPVSNHNFQGSFRVSRLYSSSSIPFGKTVHTQRAVSVIASAWTLNPTIFRRTQPLAKRYSSRYVSSEKSSYHRHSNSQKIFYTQVRRPFAATPSDKSQQFQDQEDSDSSQKSSTPAPLQASATNNGGGVSTLPPSSTAIPRSELTRKVRNERNLVLLKDMQLYQEIVRTRARLKEDSLAKMASNVYRALWGNVAICSAKFAAWLSSGSSALLAEFVHSMVDCGNQALLIVGLRESQLSADRRHPYGYGKSIYFWALVSALGTFFLGAGVSMTHAIGALMEPSLTVITPEVWGVLLFSLSVDGYVLVKTIGETRQGQPAGMTYWKHIQNIRDPATMAVLLEDGAACLGVVMALGGITASHVTGNPIFDGVAGVGISTLLGMMGIALTRLNYRFLLGQSVDKDITDDIEQILLKRKSIDRVKSIQSQWTGTDTFSFKAEVDFDGTFLAAMLMPIYQREFLEIRDTMDTELRVLLALYAEDVMRAVEREIRHVEALIRLKHPGAEYIELEPMSLDVDRLAIDDNLESDLKRVEMESLDSYLKSLKEGARERERQENADKRTPSI